MFIMIVIMIILIMKTILRKTKQVKLVTTVITIHIIVTIIMITVVIIMNKRALRDILYSISRNSFRLCVFFFLWFRVWEKGRVCT